MAVEKILLQFEADIKDLKSELGEVKTQLGGIDKKTEQVGSKMTSTFKNIGGAIAAAFTVREVIRFVGEIDTLARKAEGVEKAFNRIARPGMLDELRKATKGTVSDLQLMQNAVKASNFQIPLEQLGKLFAFANQRARETGESVDYLVDSIVLGIGRKSPLILDNLGISAVRLRSEFKGLGVESAEVGDVAAAVGRIIDEEMTKGADATTEAADAADQLAASYENLKVSLGKSLEPALMKAREGLNDFMRIAIKASEIIKMATMGSTAYAVSVGEELSSASNRAARAQSDFMKWLEKNGDEYDSVRAAADAYNETLAKQIRVYNGRIAVEEWNRKELTNETKALNDAIMAVDEYVNSLDSSVDKTEKTTDSTKKLTKAITEKDGLEPALKNVNLWLEAMLESYNKVSGVVGDNILPLLGDEADLFNEIGFLGLGNDTVIQNLVSSYQSGLLTFEQFNDLLREQIELSTGAKVANDDYLDSLIAGLGAASVLFGTYGQLLSETADKQSAFAAFGQQLAFFEIATAQAQAIAGAVKVVSNSSKTPVDYFIFLASMLASIGATIGKAKSLLSVQAPEPAFAEGVVDLRGAGTETSDSIHARLSRGESVITAKGTRQDKGLFEAANKLQLEKYIHDNYVLPALNEKKAKEDKVYDDYRIYLAMINNKKAVSDGSRDIVRAIKGNRKRYDWS